MRSILALLSICAVALCADVAAAAPPTLLSVGETDRHPTATWSLAPGTEARLVEIATAQSQGSDGYFFTENTVVFSTLEPTQTNWVYGTQLDPGTYYVHVASYDPNCDGCPLREWSNIGTLTIPGATAPTPSTSSGELTSPELVWLTNLLRFANKLARSANQATNGNLNALATFTSCRLTLSSNVGAAPTARLSPVYRLMRNACQKFEAGVKQFTRGHAAQGARLFKAGNGYLRKVAARIEALS